MRKVLLGIASVLLLANPVFAGGFGSNDGNQTNATSAGKEAYHEAKKNGSSDQRAENARSAAEATANANNADARRDTKNGELGVYVNDN